MDIVLNPLNKDLELPYVEFLNINLINMTQNY